jgi:hypothetical protein
MTFQIDQSLSLVIPRVFPQWGVDEEKICQIFHEQCIGRVYKVSIVRMPDSRRRNYPIYKAYVYFSAWYENEIAYNFQKRILRDHQARVVYDDPWHWVVFKRTTGGLCGLETNFITSTTTRKRLKTESANSKKRIFSNLKIPPYMPPNQYCTTNKL